ncbi:MAG: exodeoxyribonuclease III [Clostridiales bacterium]|jgi:exodeoxyribonuclease-3|nr:exodeoxyribonuclease III [Clostridiales bacterium]
MKFISWNVNGLRANLKKGFMNFFEEIDADFFCIQETKMQHSQLEAEFPGYEVFFHDAEKKGYSGTAIFAKMPPISVAYGLGIEEHDKEGRVITLEYDDFYLVNVYTPNSKNELLRLPYRMVWEDAFREYLLNLDAKKPVILCGDLNVAHKEIDLKNPKSNRKSAGFTDEEREKFTILLESGFVDTFRHLYPDLEGAYTWWSMISRARERNAGWRIDYFVISSRLTDKIIEAKIYPEIHGSDHCPVGLTLSFNA